MILLNYDLSDEDSYKIAEYLSRINELNFYNIFNEKINTFDIFSMIFDPKERPLIFKSRTEMNRAIKNEDEKLKRLFNRISGNIYQKRLKKILEKNFKNRKDSIKPKLLRRRESYFC